MTIKRRTEAVSYAYEGLQGTRTKGVHRKRPLPGSLASFIGNGYYGIKTRGYAAPSTVKEQSSLTVIRTRTVNGVRISSLVKKPRGRRMKKQGGRPSMSKFAAPLDHPERIDLRVKMFGAKLKIWAKKFSVALFPGFLSCNSCEDVCTLIEQTFSKDVVHLLSTKIPAKQINELLWLCSVSVWEKVFISQARTK
jgi:hypothetical protein